MGRLFRTLAVVAVGAALAAGEAQAGEDGPYVSVFGGVSLPQDTDMEIRPTDPSLFGIAFIPATIYFDPSGVGGAAVGYQWNSLAFEGEVAFRREQVDSERIPFSPDPIPLEGHQDATTLMANVYYNFDNDSRFTPYVGAGAGVAFLSLKAGTPGSPPIEVDDTAAAFQAIAGLSYAMSDSASIGLEYRYFAAQRPSYEIDLGGATATADPQYRASEVLFRATFKFN